MKEIYFYNENIAFPVFFSEPYVISWLEKIASHYAVKLGELSFIFCDDPYILDVNRRFLDHDYYTDVITFDNSRDDTISGDIFISLDTVASNAILFSVNFENEFYRVLCHSVLHLIGYNDKTDAESKVMREQENNCLELLKTLK